VEFSAAELEKTCRGLFDAIELRGIFGTDRYLRLIAAERMDLERLLRLDPLRLRRFVSRRLRQRLYDRGLRRRRSVADPDAAAIETSDFELRERGLDMALDLVAICRSGK
jgi:hypothetical protein